MNIEQYITKDYNHVFGQLQDYMLNSENIQKCKSYIQNYIKINKNMHNKEVTERAEQLFDDYSQSMELYFICCLTLIGRDNVFMDIGWMKGQHDNNLHKKENYLTDYWIFNRKFILLFFACLNNFSNKKKINNFSFIYLLFTFFIFKIKIIAVGYSNLSRIFFEKIRNFEKKKKIKFAQDIYFNNIIKVNNIKNFILKKRKDDY